MTKRVASCIGWDDDNLRWLRDRPEGMAEFLNRLVRAYRDKKSVQTAVGNDVVNPDTEVELRAAVVSVKEDIVKRQDEDEIKIRAFLRDNSHIMYMAKTQRRFKREDICRVKDELFFSKYNVDATTVEIRRILKDEMSKFDIEAYESERGILKKVE